MLLFWQQVIERENLMSGNDGIRGYYYQILATLLDSVEDETWESVIIEPITEDDKVDIKWEHSDAISVVQVKSSINNFTKKMIEDWIYKLVKDALTTYKLIGLPMNYTLYLIGTTDQGAETWISNLRNSKLDINKTATLKEIESELSKIKVKKQSFDMEGLQALAHTRMQRYIERKGKTANLETIETICDVIVGELFKYTMVQKSMSKGIFRALIEKHLVSGDFNLVDIARVSPQLSLSFYESDKVQDNNSMHAVQLEDLPILGYLKTNARENLQKAKSIKLAVQELSEQKAEIKHKVQDAAIKSNTEDTKTIDWIQQVPESLKDQFEKAQIFSKWAKENSLTELFPKDGYIPVRMKHEEIEELKDLSKSILGINLTDEDFYFGGLEERLNYTQRMFSGPVKIPRGTDKEIEKYYAIENAHTNLLIYQELVGYSNYLKTYYPLPIILKNTGVVAAENIQVTLTFPPTAKVQTPERFQFQPQFELFIEDFIKDERYFSSIIMPSRVHNIMNYEGLKRWMPVLTKPKIPFETITYSKMDFVNHLNYLFKYDHYDYRGQDIIQYEFKALNPGCNMAFPSFLLIKTDSNFEIRYKITSKQLSIPIEGTLQWMYPD
jgi:hypothetical protein